MFGLRRQLWIEISLGSAGNGDLEENGQMDLP